MNLSLSGGGGGGGGVFRTQRTLALHNCDLVAEPRGSTNSSSTYRRLTLPETAVRQIFRIKVITHACVHAKVHNLYNLTWTNLVVAVPSLLYPAATWLSTKLHLYRDSTPHHMAFWIQPNYIYTSLSHTCVYSIKGVFSTETLAEFQHVNILHDSMNLGSKESS